MLKKSTTASTFLTLVPRSFTNSSHSFQRGTRQLPARSNKQMSWMDSWSRPSKSQATPAPYYLLPGGEATPYCHSCGRVISTRKANVGATSNTPAKYCSNKCKTKKPRALDREIEGMFVRLLLGGEEPQTESKPKSRKKPTKHVKGDPRILVSCSTVEEAVFKDDPTTHDEILSTRSKSPELDENEAAHRGDFVADKKDPDTGDRLEKPDTNLNDVLASKEVDYDTFAALSIRSGKRIRPPQQISEVNGSVGGEKGWAEKIEETDEMLEKRRIGQRKANKKETVKCAARRGVVFGFLVDGDESGERRKCEAVMNGKVVEPSFAKGNWGIRWRE